MHDGRNNWEREAAPSDLEEGVGGWFWMLIAVLATIVTAIILFF